MAHEKMTTPPAEGSTEDSTTEEAMDALKRKGAIVKRSQELQSSTSFESLSSQAKQKFENYRLLIGGSLSEKNSRFGHELSNFEKFMDKISA